MKKIIALALAALIVCALPVVALAGDSPTAVETIKVSIQKGSFEGTDDKVDELVSGRDGTVTAVADPTQGTFREWTIFKVENDTSETKYSVAKAGTDYEITSGDLKSSPMTVKPLTDIVICGNYDNTVTDPQTGEAKDTAPKTGAETAALVVVAVLALAGAGVATKKVLA